MMGSLRAGRRTMLLGALAAPHIARAQAVRQLRMGTIAAANSPWHRAMNRFTEVAAGESGGALRVTPFTDSQLGDLQQLLAGMQLGTIEMAYLGLGTAVILRGADPLKVIYAPYLFTGKEGATKAMNSPEFERLYEDIAGRTGVRIVGAYGARSPRAIQTTRGPVRRPEDLRGMKLRIPPIDVFQATFEALGVQNTPLGVGEIYTAMSRGLVEGQDNGFDLSIPLRFHEVAKHWSATDHGFELTGWFMSNRLWSSLSPAHRNALVAAARAGGEVTTRETEALDNEGRDILRQHGVTYTEPDRDAFRAATANVYRRFEGPVWPEGLVAKVREMQER